MYSRIHCESYNQIGWHGRGEGGGGGGGGEGGSSMTSFHRGDGKKRDKMSLGGSNLRDVIYRQPLRAIRIQCISRMCVVLYLPLQGRREGCSPKYDAGGGRAPPPIIVTHLNMNKR